MTSDEFIQTFTRSEMATQLGVSERQFYRLLAKGDKKAQAVVSGGILGNRGNIARLALLMNEINVITQEIQMANPPLAQSLIQPRTLMGKWVLESLEDAPEKFAKQKEG